MITQRLRLGILLAVAVTSSLTSAGLSAQKVDHIKPGKKYDSPLKNFSVMAPDLCLGTKIQKANDRDQGMVGFLSDVGQLSRIDYVRLDPELVQAVAGLDWASTQQLYEERLRVLLQPSNATLIVQEPHSVVGTVMLFALAEFPGGAAVETVTIRDGQLSRRREDSVRGLLTFVRGGFLYVLHHEVGVDFEHKWPCGLQGQSGPHLSREEQIRAAKEGLHQFYALITFN